MLKKIVVYDSGIGGASILKEVKKLLPEYPYYYFVDTLNAPYGTKTKREILKIVVENIVKIGKKVEIEALILACNTASSACGKEIRKIFPFPIVCVEPPIKKAIEMGFKNISILATPSTLENNLTIKKYEKTSAKDVVITKIGLEKLATEIDENAQNLDLILPYLRKNLKVSCDCLVVGCTHYNFIKKQLQLCVPSSEIISCEKAIAIQTQKVFKEANLCRTKFSMKIVLSKRNARIRRFLCSFLRD